jgi:hypothetical protein
VNETTDWEKLEEFLVEHKDNGKVSVSGGGDCLYEYYKHLDWWERLFNLTDNLNMKVDVHSRTRLYERDFWQRVHRCVFSIDSLYGTNKNYLSYLVHLTKIRITHVVTQNTSFGDIYEFVQFQKSLNYKRPETDCQFTIKQLVGYDDHDRYDLIKNKFPGIYSLEQGDYNIYYMPDNSVTHQFL